jgi:ferredoxin-nitrite reductase
MTPAVKDGVHGFNVRVAGGEGSWGRQHALPLDAFVEEDEAVELGLRILDVFSDNGQREKRNKARMKFLLDDWGIERFREEVAARLTYELKTAGEELARREPGPRDHIGVGQQKEEGLRYVGLLVPTGRMQLHQIFELARVAEEYGNGEVRLTSQQNVLVPNVPEERLEEFLAEPLLEELSPKPNPFMRGLVTCIGKNFCPVSLIDTKEQGRKLAQYLDDRLGPEVEEAMGVFRIHTSGCVNSCARPHTGHVGLIGKQVKRNGGSVDGANIQLGGEQGLDGGFNEKWQQKVDFEEMAPMLEAEIRRYLDEREPEENFRDWCLRTGTVVQI